MGTAPSAKGGAGTLIGGGAGKFIPSAGGG
jgi:hypothetical protein